MDHGQELFLSGQSWAIRSIIFAGTRTREAVRLSFEPLAFINGSEKDMKHNLELATDRPVWPNNSL